MKTILVTLFLVLITPLAEAQSFRYTGTARAYSVEGVVYDLALPISVNTTFAKSGRNYKYRSASGVRATLTPQGSGAYQGVTNWMLAYDLRGILCAYRTLITSGNFGSSRINLFASVESLCDDGAYGILRYKASLRRAR